MFKYLLSVSLFLGCGVIGLWSLAPAHFEATLAGFSNHDDRLYFNNKIFNGVYVERYQNGALFKESNFRAGVRNGQTKQFALNGRLIERSHYDRGLRQGVSLGWFTEGPKKFVFHYKDGNLDGLQTQWHLNGRIFRQEFFVEGVVSDRKILFSGGEIFTNFAIRDGRTYGLDGGPLCMEPIREGVKR